MQGERGGIEVEALRKTVMGMVHWGLCKGA